MQRHSQETRLLPTVYPGCIFHPASQKGISFSADLPHLGWRHERDVSFMAGDATGAAGTVSAFRAPTDNNGMCLLDFIPQNQNHPAEENLKQINLWVLFFTPFLTLSLANDSGVTQTRTPLPLSPALPCAGTSSFSSRRCVYFLQLWWVYFSCYFFSNGIFYMMNNQPCSGSCRACGHTLSAPTVMTERFHRVLLSPFTQTFLPTLTVIHPDIPLPVAMQLHSVSSVRR